MEDNPNIWAPATHTGDLDGVLDTSLQPSPTPVIAAICEVNQWMEDLSIYTPALQTAFLILQKKKKAT